MERLQILMDFFITTVQFQKLERIEIGGLRGKALSHSVSQVLKEFKELYLVFTVRTYDCLDPEETAFIVDYEHFNNGIISLDRKLGATLTRALEDCTMSDSIFKLLHVFGAVTERKLVAVELNKNIPKLVDSLKKELEMIEDIMKMQKRMIRDFGAPVVDRNMPKVTGQLNLVLEIKTRIQYSVKNLKELNHPVKEGKDAAEIIDKATGMVTSLEQIEQDTYSTWATATEKTTAKVGTIFLIISHLKCLHVMSCNTVIHVKLC